MGYFKSTAGIKLVKYKLAAQASAFFKIDRCTRSRVELVFQFGSRSTIDRLAEVDLNLRRKL